MSIKPLIRYQFKVGAAESAMEPVTADCNPRRMVEAAARVDTWRYDVKQVRKFLADPGPAVVLVRNRVDAQLADELSKLVFRPRITYFPQCLSQHVWATPYGHPQRPRIFPIDRAYQGFRS